MTIIELGRTTPINLRTDPDNQFVRKVKLGPYTVDATLLAAFPGLDESDRPEISVTFVRDESGAQYDAKQSVDGVYAEPFTFFFDNALQTLWVHIGRTDSPFTTVYFYGLAQGFAQGKMVYVDNEAFLPLIESTPGLRQQQDLDGVAVLSFITGSVSISNLSGRLDNLIPQPVYGNDVLIYHLPDGESGHYTRDDLLQVASVFVEDYDLSTQKIDLRIQDRRKAQNIDIPVDRFNDTDYPNIYPETNGKVIPVLWGTAREIPAVVTNGEVTTGNVTYRAALLLTNIGTVQVETDAGWETVTPLNTSLATGEFELSAGDARDANGNPLDCKLVDSTGIAISRITDVIKDASERFGDVAYTASNYDITEWEAEELTLTSTGGYYIDSEKRLFDVILDLQNGANVGFRYEIKPDGRRTIRIDDETRTPVAYISNTIIANRDNINVKTDSRLLAAEIIVKYGLSYQSGRSLRYVDTTERQKVLDIYNQAPRREYPLQTNSAINTETDAIERAGYIKDRFSRIRGIVEIEVMCADLDRRDLLSLRVYDIVDIEITPSDFVDRDAGTIAGREFYGIKRCKVLSIDPDTSRSVNTITAVIID